MQNDSTQTDWENFLHWEYGSRDVIEVKRCYIDLAGDLIAGILLSQIVYWHLPSRETGEPRMKIEKLGHLWLVKSRDEWMAECRITPKQADRALAILRDKNLIIYELHRFNNVPTAHIRINQEIFIAKLRVIVKKPILPKGQNQTLTKGENQTLPKGQNAHIPEKVKSYNRDYSQRSEDLKNKNKEKEKREGSPDPERAPAISSQTSKPVLAPTQPTNGNGHDFRLTSDKLELTAGLRALAQESVPEYDIDWLWKKFLPLWDAYKWYEKNIDYNGKFRSFCMDEVHKGEQKGNGPPRIKAMSAQAQPRKSQSIAEIHAKMDIEEKKLAEDRRSGKRI